MTLVVGGELLPPIRYAVYERDGYRCRDCRKAGRLATVGAIIEDMWGGRDED